MKHNWEYKRLGEVCEFIGGGTPTKSKDEYYKGKIPWATVRDMLTFRLSKTELLITEDAVKNSATNILPKGMIIISTHVGLGKICELMQETAINQDLKGISFFDNSIDKYFFVYWYRSIANYIISKGRGATVKGVTLNFMKNLVIPVPPMDVQQRIVAELDKINEVIEDCRELLRNLDELAQSLFYDYFGDPISNPKGWETKPLRDIVKGKLSYGSGASGVPFDGLCRYIRITDIDDNGYLKPEIASSPSVLDDKYLLEEGDVLFARSGATVGKSFLYNTKIGKAIYAGYLIKASTNPDYIIPMYLYAITKTAYYREYIKNSIRGAAQPNVNAALYGAFQIPVPPIALQEEFAERIEAIEGQKTAVEETIAELKTLLDSRMDYWFN